MSTKKIIPLSFALVALLGSFYIYNNGLERLIPKQPIRTAEQDIESGNDKLKGNETLRSNSGIKLPNLKNTQKNSFYSEYPPKVRDLLIEISRPLTLKEQQKYQNEINDFNNLAFSDYHHLSLDILQNYARNGDGLAHYILSYKDTEILDQAILESHAVEAIKKGFSAYTHIGSILSLSPETRSKGLAYLIISHKQGYIRSKKELVRRFEMAPISTADLEKAIAMVPELNRQLSQ